MARASGIAEIEPALGWRAWSGAPSRMSRAHRHDDLELNYMRRGWYRYLIGGELVTLTEGRVLALWGAFPHQSVGRGAEAEMAWATLPLTDAMAMGLPEGLIGRLLTRGWVLDGEARAGDGAMFARWEADLAGKPTGSSQRSTNDGGTKRRATGARAARQRGSHRAAAETRHIVALEVEARLRRLAGAAATSAKATGGGEAAAGALDTVAQMARYIADRYRQPLRVDEVAAAVGLNPSYAMTLFRRRTGVTIIQYLNRQRVAHAQRLLVTTSDGVTDIALDAGFGSISRFYEAFNEATGLTPRAFRQRVRTG